MSKAITLIAKAFANGVRTNPALHTSTDGKAVYLHGNKIAWWERTPAGDEVLCLTLAGHPTPTTRDRLNHICEAALQRRPFFQRGNKQWYKPAALTDPARELQPDEVVRVTTYDIKATLADITV